MQIEKDLKIRLANRKDYAQVNNLLLELHNYHIALRPDNYKPIDLFITKKMFNKKLKQQLYFVAEINDELIGIINVGFTENDFGQKCPIIHAFYVKDEYRNLKIGSKLFYTLKEYVNSLDENYSKSITLTVDSLNKNSIEFYKKMGFDFSYFGMHT